MATERNVVRDHRCYTDTPEEGVALYVGTASFKRSCPHWPRARTEADVLGMPYVENESAACEPKENRLEKAASHSRRIEAPAGDTP